VIAKSLELGARLAHGPERAFQVARPVRPEPRHYLQGFKCHPTVQAAGGIQAKELMVTGQGANANTQPVPSLRQMIEIGYAMGALYRMVVGEQMSQRSQMDSFGAFQCLRD